MSPDPKEKREFERFSTETKIFFQVVAFDVKTRIDFQMIDKETGKPLSRKYSALSKNVSVKGLCFSCGQKLNKGDLLFLEVEVATQKNPIPMEGEVKWSAPDPSNSNKFDTGISLSTVNGKDVSKTFQSDENNEVVWSAVLESILGSFKK